MARPGRKAFKGMAPKGYRIRMMEPGEAEALLALRNASAPAGAAPLPLHDFVRLLVSHEIYVAADKASGEPAAFAAAREADGLYLLAGLYVVPGRRGRGLGGSLLAAVTERARWFQYRAVGVADVVDNPRVQGFYARHGFVSVAPDASAAPSAGLPAGAPPSGAAWDVGFAAARAVMVKWL